MVKWLVGSSVLAACAAGPPRAPAAGSLDGSDVTLYRDGALVQQRVELDVPAGGVATARVRIPAGLGAGAVVAFPRDGVALVELREAGAVKTASPAAPTGTGTALELELSDESLAALGLESAAEELQRKRPAELELVVRARPGRAALRLGYVTDRLTWEVAYTLTANAAHDQAVLRGAVAIRNKTGIELPAAQVRIIDSELADARTYAADQLASQFTRQAPGAPPPPPRELGRLDLADGDTRVELLRDPAPRPMRSVLVYDPIGTQYDRGGGGTPATEAGLGVRPPAGPDVDESFEFERDPAATAGLPAGPVRLLERRADGSLALLGEARLFEATARVAVSDTIAVGTAAGVTGERERRELTVDHERKRVVEEFVITIDNQRPRPVEVVVREHLYRSTTWTLAYISVPVGDEAKEGPQQVAPRITVPPRSKGRIMYAVVYWW
jgi:hypothetical protein